LSREDLANIAGTATETVIRLLAEFKNENIISTKARKIEILDVNKLIETGNLSY
jgi:CRP-like cAMP-binding protein